MIDRASSNVSNSVGLARQPRFRGDPNCCSPKHSSLPFAAAELTARLGQPPRPEESRA